MKFLVLASLFISSQVFALDLCKLRDTYEFDEAARFERLKVVRQVTNNFSALERQMIHEAVKLQNWRARIGQAEALRAFGDFYDGYRGPNPGEIVYYQLGAQKLALVHYWPGENEYGAFFLGTKLVARIDDGEISCEF